MNSIEFELEVIEADQVVEYDSIEFSSCCLVRVKIDNEYLHHQNKFEDVVLVLAEVEKSCQQNGDYLIMVCACGIADDGGWDKIKVSHTDKLINWNFFREEKFTFSFEKGQYISSLKYIVEKYKKIAIDYELEPSVVVDPE